MMARMTASATRIKYHEISGWTFWYLGLGEQDWKLTWFKTILRGGSGDAAELFDIR